VAPAGGRPLRRPRHCRALSGWLHCPEREPWRVSRENSSSCLRHQWCPSTTTPPVMSRGRSSSGARDAPGHARAPQKQRPYFILRSKPGDRLWKNVNTSNGVPLRERADPPDKPLQVREEPLSVRCDCCGGCLPGLFYPVVLLETQELQQAASGDPADVQPGDGLLPSMLLPALGAPPPNSNRLVFL
jgi:hypothetical protein